jgi:endo-1,4-beta-xylanase
VKRQHTILALLLAAGCGSAGPAVPDADGSVTPDDASLPGADAAVAVDPHDALAGSWSCLEGATQAASGAVDIRPIDRWIVGYEPAPRTANPPIMMVGPRLALAGGAFTLELELRADADSAALLSLNGKRPIVYDEWRQEGTALAVGLEAGKLLVKVWDGTRATPTTTRLGRGLGRALRVTLTVDGDRATFGDAATGAALGQVDLPARLFPDDRVYFGADVAPGNALHVERLEVSGAAEVVRSSTPGTVPASATSLRALAAPGGRAIGTAVASFPLLGEDAYATTLGREFSMVTPENMMKFQFIHPARDVYAFCDADALVDFAHANGMTVHGHALVWGEAVPEWVSKGDFSDAELAEILHQHITTVVTHFRGRVEEWDVLNEPLDDDAPELRDTIWAHALGADYVATIFRWAHEADPAAKLYVNEYGIEEAGAKASALFTLVKNARAAGVPLDGVGFQGHEDLDEETDPAELRVNMAKYQPLGVVVRISELDDNPGHAPSASELARQAAFYRQELDACLALPHCVSFSMWGFTDKYSSLADDGAYDAIGHGLVFDAAYAAKPAYDALVDGLMP